MAKKAAKNKGPSSQANDRIALSSLVPHPRNEEHRKMGDAERAGLRASIETGSLHHPGVKEGEYRLDTSITVNKQGNRILGGHRRVEVLEDLGQEWIDKRDVCFVDYEPDSSDELACVIKLNSRAISGEFDRAGLESLLGDVGTDYDLFESLRFDDLAITEGIDLSRLAGGDGEDESSEELSGGDELQKKWGTERGQLWLVRGEVGEHRVIVGDCREPAVYDALFGDMKMNVVVTSPPYASQRKYDEESGFKPVPIDKYVEWFNQVQENIACHLAEDGSFFLNIKEHCDDGQRVLYVKDLTIAHVREWGWKFVDEYCWPHGGTPKNVDRRFKNGWEPIFQFSRGKHKFRPDNVRQWSTNVPRGTGGHPSDEQFQGRGVNILTPEGVGGMQGRGDALKAVNITSGYAYPSNVVRVGKNREALGHSAAYPPELVSYFIKAFSDPGDAVCDPFMGSGTVIVSCEKNARLAYGIELSPVYVAVSLERAAKLGCECVLQ